MQVLETGISGLVQIIPSVFADDRGWFMEFTKRSAFARIGITDEFSQDNISYSRQGVIRGLHLQKAPFAQSKLVTVLAGRVIDVAVDLRPGSPTFLKHAAIELSAGLHNMLYIPAGFAHGFSVLEDATFFYKCSTEYNPAAEAGIRWNDPELAIDWRVDNPIVSAKDAILPTAADLISAAVI
ncbi:MAG: dTDP-4-dehydrorhamnose 3,5-epimerase [Bacteroidota bacterium]